MNHGGIRRPVNRDGRYTKIMTVLWRNSSPEKRRMTAILRSPFMMQFWDGFGENADIEGREIVRPFWPGGDYEHYDYPDGCVVVDNPPFSIFTQVCRFFQSRNISFFLFAPHLTLLSPVGMNWTGIVCDARVTYENGACVDTSFASNLFGDIRIMTAPDLLARIKNAAKTKRRLMDLPKIHLPGQCGIRRIVGQDSPLRQIRGAGVRMSKGPQTR